MEKLPPPAAFDPVESQPAEWHYQLLVAHRRTDGSWKTSEQLRSEYVQLTDGLIHDMADGVYVEDPQTHEHSIERPDFVIWLDKSARPVSWLTRDLWPLLARDKGGNVPEMPAFRYVNIDKEQWVNAIDPHGDALTKVDHLDPSIIRSLRSIFIAPQHKKEGLNEKIDHTPSELDNKTILVVDEVRSTGKTLEIAQNFFRRAFPTARVAGAYWMGGQVMRGDGAVGNADLPVWYSDKSNFGRGVGNRNDILSSKSKSSTQRLGRFFLGTSLPKVPIKDQETNDTQFVMDPRSTRLREELKHLSEDAYAGRMLIIPSIDRDIMDLDERAVRLNHMEMSQFIEAVQKLKAT